MRWINGLHYKNVRGDIYGGITAAVVALPLALAMGVTSGAGPVAGLYGAIFVGFFAALFGGTPAQVSGPTGPMTVVMAVIFTEYTTLFPDNPTYGAALAFTVVIMGGLFQIMFGFLKVGKYIELVPHPVVSGFMSGIGVIIILLQIGPLLGHAGVARPIDALISAPSFFANPQMVPIILGIITLLVVYTVPHFFPKINKMMPSPLLSLIIGTLAYVLFFSDSVIPIIGNIPTGIPTPQFPTIEITLIGKMIGSALMLAALGSIDSLLTSLVADNITRSFHKSDRELIGQGIGNTIAGVFGGLPGAGATMRTVVNVKAGGQTPISGSLHAVVLLAIVLGAGSLASNIPYAVLAGILVKVGTDIIDWKYLKKIVIAPKAGVIIMFTVLALTVFVDLLIAVAVGITMASLLLMKRVSEQQLQSVSVSTKPDDAVNLSAQEMELFKQAQDRVLLYQLRGPMSFGAAKGISRRLASFDHYDVLILDLEMVPSIDYTSSLAIEDMILDTQESKRSIYIVGAQNNVLSFLNRQKILKNLADGHQLPKRLDALSIALKEINTRTA